MGWGCSAAYLALPRDQGPGTGMLPPGSSIPGMPQPPPEVISHIPVRGHSFSRREVKLFSSRIFPCGSGHGAAPGMPPGKVHGKKKLGKSFQAKLRKRFCHKTPCPSGARSKGRIPFGFPLLNPTPELEPALLAPGSRNPDFRRSK